MSSPPHGPHPPLPRPPSSRLLSLFCLLLSTCISSGRAGTVHRCHGPFHLPRVPERSVVEGGIIKSVSDVIS